MNFFHYTLLFFLYLENNSCNSARRGRLVTGVSQAADFDCPEEFGYYPHPTDCTQYYVCVFGGALLESCTGGLMYSHELQTCDWPRNVGCGAESESATVSTVRVTDARTRHTTPTSRSPVIVSRVQSDQQRQQQEQLAKHQLYAEDLGPAEEIESDRQQRVYRGQPSTLGQVARDRDGLRHQPVTNALPTQNTGRAVNGDKIAVISFGSQQQSQNNPQYSITNDLFTQDDNLLTNETESLGLSRKKRQIRYRVEPSAEPVAYVQQQPIISSSSNGQSGNVYNNTQHYDPTQYDPYYNLYDDDVELYRDVDYSQFTSNGGNTQYRGQISYKQQEQKGATYPQPNYNAQDVYSQNIGVQDYNDNYNSAVNDQYDQQAGNRPSNKQTISEEPNDLSYTSDPDVSSSAIPPSTTTTTIRPEAPSRQLTRQREDPTRYTVSPKLETPRKPLQRDFSSTEKVLTRQALRKPPDYSPSFINEIDVSVGPSKPIELSTDSARSLSRRISNDYSVTTNEPTPENSNQLQLRSRINSSRRTPGDTSNSYLSNQDNNSSNENTSVGRSNIRKNNVQQRRVTSNFQGTSTESPLASRNIFREHDTTTVHSYFSNPTKRVSNPPTTSSSEYASQTNPQARRLHYTTVRSSPAVPVAQVDRNSPLDSRGVSFLSTSLSNNSKSKTTPASKTFFRATIENIQDYSTPEQSSSTPPQVETLLGESIYPDKDVTWSNSIVQTESTTIISRSRTRRPQPTLCEEDTETNKNTGCNNTSPSRVTVPPRNRGSASFTTSAAINNVVGEPANRGTPASVRTRPTLKPSTVIVSKASEFVDIYKNPPKRPDPVYPTPQVDKTAAKCRKDICLLPDCYCGGKEIPGNIATEEVPQIVMLTFDDAVNDLNKGLYSDLFENGRRNPNGCPISATYYVSHEWTDYSQVQNLYADGHEMASHSVSHSFGEQFSQKKWTKEIAGQREILAAYGGVRLEDVRGMRAPFLAVGGNKMFKMLYDSNFTYDSSMPVYENRPPSWPYTLDYKIFHDCMIPPCPTRSYPGIWEVPMVMWQDLNGGRCSMGDACSNPPTSDGVYKMLIKNFERHYTTNRAPFGLFYHAAWFTQPHHKEGFIAFLDTIVNMQDVWLVTNWQAIQWIRDPTPLSRINNFKPWQCNYPERPKRCNNPKVCNLWHKSGVRYMRTCQPCPDIYPWTGKTGVRNSKVDNEIIEE